MKKDQIPKIQINIVICILGTLVGYFIAEIIKKFL